MNSRLKYYALLLILFLSVNIAGIFLRQQFGLVFRVSDLFTLSLAFALIAAATIFIFFRGRQREEKEQVMHTFVGISAKFIAELFLALALFVIAKKTGFTYVLLFFVLYLTFSLFSVGVILKTLKKKTL